MRINFLQVKVRCNLVFVIKLELGSYNIHTDDGHGQA